MILLIVIAFVSGILSVLSPCILPILPIVLASGIGGNKSRIRGIIIGLVLSFSFASLVLASLVRMLKIPADTVRLVAVLLLLLLGISLAFHNVWDKIQTLIEKFWRFNPKKHGKGGFWEGLITGISLGIVWTPCVGPILSTTATLAAINAFSSSLILIVISYAIGIALPMYAFAKGGNKAISSLGFIKSENTNIRKIFGVIIIITAISILFGIDKSIQSWTIKHLPNNWVNITTAFEKRFNIREILQ